MDPTTLSKQKVLDEFDLLLTSNEFGLNKKAEEFVFIETSERPLLSSSVNTSNAHVPSSTGVNTTSFANTTNMKTTPANVPPPAQQQQVPKSFSSSKVVSLWFLRQITQSNHEEGIYLSQHLFLPRNLWETLKVRDTLLRSRIECMDTVTRLGEQFLKHQLEEKRVQQQQQQPLASQISSGLRRESSINSSTEELLKNQSAELVKLEQRFHISFIEPLSILLPREEKQQTATNSGTDSLAHTASALANNSTSHNLLNSAVSRLSIISSNSSFSHSSGTSTPKSSFFFNRKSVLQNSINSPTNGLAPLSSTVTAATMSNDEGLVSKQPNFQSLNNNHNLPSQLQVPPVSTALTPYLAALTSLISVLDAVYACDQDSPTLKKWVDGYSRFISRVVCRLILKDILYLIDGYQTKIRDWLLG